MTTGTFRYGGWAIPTAVFFAVMTLVSGAGCIASIVTGDLKGTALCLLLTIISISGVVKIVQGIRFNSIEFQPDRFVMVAWPKGEISIMNSDLTKWDVTRTGNTTWFCVHLKQGQKVPIDPGFENRDAIYREIQQRVLANGGWVNPRLRPRH